jgi:catechol 2,3-dioxygenase-like lactoylglutathione lyase family enzyme
VLRVHDLEAALAMLPPSLRVTRGAGGVAAFDGPEGLGLGLVERERGTDYDIDHTVLRVPEPEATVAGLARLGFDARDGRLHVGDKHLVLERGSAAGGGGAQLLNHIALLVDSGAEWLEWSEAQGIEVVDVRDAENTFAVFVRGPDGIEIEYVEHKPTFSLV